MLHKSFRNHLKTASFISLLAYLCCFNSAKAQQKISFTVNNSSNTEVELSDQWKFHLGDNIDFAKSNFNDSLWPIMKVDSVWENRGFDKYDGIAWYRLHVTIPSKLKVLNSELQAVLLALACVDDRDDTYFNGEKIGSLTGYDAKRNYLVLYNKINWDSDNVIAIKVTDYGGFGGMWGKNRKILNVKLPDIVGLSTIDMPLEYNSNITSYKRTLKFNFKIPISKLRGQIKVKVYENNTDNVVLQRTDSIYIGNKADSVYTVSVNLNKPDTYRIDYAFTVNNLTDTLKLSTLYTYVLNKRENEHFEYPVISNAIPGKVNLFELNNMAFTGYLNNWFNSNLNTRLLNIDEKGILECFYNRPGKQTWAGEYAGKYLFAATRVWQLTDNKLLKTQMDRIVDILIACQNADGYLGSYLPENYWTDWDVWAHKYQILGLLSYYSVTGYKPALESSIKIGNLLCNTFGNEHGKLNINESSGHKGMASTSVLEPMIELYRFTGDKKYLKFCEYIIEATEFNNGSKIVSTLTTIGKVDKTANGKAYEMLSNLIGFVKLYQLTGNQQLLKATEIAWKDIVKYKLYITGTTSKTEHFAEDLELPANENAGMGEGCVTVTWFQLNQALYYVTGEPKYINEIERTVYNHLLGAQNPKTGCVSLHMGLQYTKEYDCNIDANCCLASLPRGIASVPEIVYAKNAKNGFRINLYTSSTLTDKIFTKRGNEVAVNCEINSKYPIVGEASITINTKQKCEFSLMLYVPMWCNNFKATINGKTLNGIAGNYLTIENEWNGKTTINVTYNINVQVLEGGKSYPNNFALKYGPQVLAIDADLNKQIDSLDNIFINSPQLSVLSEKVLPIGWFGTQLFETNAFYKGKDVKVKLVPFAEASQNGGDIRVWIKKK